MRSRFPPLWRGGAARAPTHFFPEMSVCPAQEPGARPRAILNFEPVQPLVMRVLIVEDDNALADGLIRTLRQSGYAVDHAESGELALRACAEEHYDLVVVVVQIPGIERFDGCEQVQHDHLCRL